MSNLNYLPLRAKFINILIEASNDADAKGENDRSNAIMAALHIVKAIIPPSCFVTIKDKTEIDDLINSIKVDSFNLEYIIKSGKVNGSLRVEIVRVLNQYLTNYINS